LGGRLCRPRVQTGLLSWRGMVRWTRGRRSRPPYGRGRVRMSDLTPAAILYATGMAARIIERWRQRLFFRPLVGWAAMPPTRPNWLDVVARQGALNAWTAKPSTLRPRSCPNVRPDPGCATAKKTPLERRFSFQPADQPTHLRALRNIRIHGDSSPQDSGAHECTEARNTRSACGIRTVKRPSAVVTDVSPPGEPFGLNG
jgi:hypothetical protein